MEILEIKNNKELFKKTVQDVFEPVEQEHGWKVILDGFWCQKKANAKTIRVYRSLASAKDRTEQEFYSYFRNGRCIYDAKNGVNYFYNIDRKSFRKYMNYLYETKLVQYEQI